MVLAQKAHTDVKMDLWLVSACLGQDWLKHSCRAQGLNNKAAWSVMQAVCPLMSDIYLWISLCGRHLYVSHKINQSSCRLANHASKLLLGYFQHTTVKLACVFLSKLAGITFNAISYKAPFFFSYSECLSFGSSSSDWLDSHQLFLVVSTAAVDCGKVCLPLRIH